LPDLSPAWSAGVEVGVDEAVEVSEVEELDDVVVIKEVDVDVSVNVLEDV
jgi:hypothetical protein